MNRSSIIFEENEKKKRKLSMETPNYDASFLSNYVNEYSINHICFTGVGGNEIRSNDICVNGMGRNQQHTNQQGLNQNPFDKYIQNRMEYTSSDMTNNCNNVHFNKNVLINSIDILLNFMNYSCLNETIKHEVLCDNLLNLRFHILSLNDEKFNQKKITEYFLKM
ncbi:hypothetical protein, conserved [Plasmodium gonderi]|uniref:Uncharacterized protein n=1 Tax=Plasmodium gonderi TaxID=77519 RepID=A0A1Y1JHU8_PLAGO|nr:hypothetical protein, conserved [Plasmodium gonderi]GAW82106.1 hypothetical protein, conserved [Plasmodium gonderi]